MMTVRSEICGECPFRRESAAGWLGSNDPESFAAEALSEQSIACHVMMKQEGPRAEWLERESETVRCRGAITLMRNKCQLPRDPAMRDLVKTVTADRATVFNSPQEFAAYHRASNVRSWEFE